MAFTKQQSDPHHVGLQDLEHVGDAVHCGDGLMIVLKQSSRESLDEQSKAEIEEQGKPISMLKALMIPVGHDSV